MRGADELCFTRKTIWHTSRNFTRPHKKNVFSGSLKFDLVTPVLPQYLIHSGGEKPQNTHGTASDTAKSHQVVESHMREGQTQWHRVFRL